MIQKESEQYSGEINKTLILILKLQALHKLNKKRTLDY